MPDFHLPNDEDRRAVSQDGDVAAGTGHVPERTKLDDLVELAVRAGIADAERLSRADLVEALRIGRPAGRVDPGAPDRPLT